MPTQQEIIRKRLRQVGEPIVTSPQLREALNDDQASELFDWGMAVLQKTAAETAVQPDKEAMPTLERQATAISLIMELVNQLIAHPDKLPDQDDIVNSRLVRLGKNLFWLTGQKRKPGHSRRVAAFERIRQTADSDILFRHLMSILQGYTDEEIDA